MAQRILVFESDQDFASDIQTNFESLGTEVEVVADGTTGLQRAADTPPDLILLSIELPSMNGFLVCKKIKKNPQLKDIPLVILSSDANAEEIFEQHKKLRTRAEEYIRKPVPFEDLLARVKRLIPIGEGEPVEAIDISEEVVGEGAPESTDVHDRENVDDEIDAFADSAFDNLMLGDEGESTAVGDVPPEIQEDRVDTAASQERPAAHRGRSSPPGPATEPPGHDERAGEEAASVGEEDLVEVDEVEGEISKVQKAPPGGEDPELRAQLEAAEAKVSSLEDQLREAQREAAEVERLEKEVADLKSKVQKGGGVSSREFLDLREALNKKDKEILDLKDQVSARDKQVLELRDSSLVLERGKADFEDKIVGLEEQLRDQSQKLEAAEADKLAASKRNEDLKARLERTEDKARKLGDELDSQKAERAEEVQQLTAERDQQIEQLKAEQAETLQQVQDKAQEQSARAAARHANEVEDLQEAHDKQLQELKAEREQEVEALKAEREQEVEGLKAEHAQQLEGLRGDHERAAEEARQQHEGALAQLEEQHAGELERTTREAAEQKDTELAQLRAQLGGEMEEKLEEAERRRQSELAAAEQDKTQALEELRQELEGKHAAEMQETNDRHSKDLSLLGRKLTETEGKLEETSEKLLETEQERDAGRQELEQRTEERDTLSAELSAARASLAEAEQRAGEQSERIATLEQQQRRLEDVQRDLEQRLDQAQAKIAADSQLLERARKAMAIGLGLLEDQKNNRPEQQPPEQ